MSSYEPLTIEDFIRKASDGGEYEREMYPINLVFQEAVLLYGDKLIELERRIEVLEQSAKSGG